MDKKIATVVSVFLICILGFTVTPAGRRMWNNWFFDVQKADDETSYQTLKKVEDTCRAMMASYETDKLIYEQFVGSTSDEERGWASQARMRANKTAATYNKYMLENSFIWKSGVPDDIDEKLEYVGG